MFFIEIETIEEAKNLSNICDIYKERMYIDVSHGRQVIDGTNMLGIASLIGNIVKINPITHDEDLINSFYNDIKSIGAYKV